MMKPGSTMLWFLLSAFCCFLTTVATANEPITNPSSSCTLSMAGTPSCNFDKGLCSYTSIAENGRNLKWSRTDEKLGLVTGDWQSNKDKKGSYVYLDASDPNVPINSRVILSGQLSTGISAVCIEFHYATSGNQNHSIRIYNQQTSGFNSRDTDHLIGELEDVNTGGQWQVAHFTSCVDDASYIAFESEKVSSKSTVAIDYVAIKRSTQMCQGTSPQTTVKSSSPQATRPSSSTTKYEVSTETPDPSCTLSTAGTPSCNFDKGLCSYTSIAENGRSLKWSRTDEKVGLVTGDWQSNKDKKGSYVYLDVSDPNVPINSRVILSGQLGTGISAVCIEFHYATSGNQNHSVRIYNQQTSGFNSRDTDNLIGKLEDVNTGGQWQVAHFTSCVDDASYLAFESEKVSSNSTVAIDFVKITLSKMDCKQQTDATTAITIPVQTTVTPTISKSTTTMPTTTTTVATTTPTTTTTTMPTTTTTKSTTTTATPPPTTTTLTTIPTTTITPTTTTTTTPTTTTPTITTTTTPTTTTPTTTTTTTPTTTTPTTTTPTTTTPTTTTPTTTPTTSTPTTTTTTTPTTTPTTTTPTTTTTTIPTTTTTTTPTTTIIITSTTTTTPTTTTPTPKTTTTTSTTKTTTTTTTTPTTTAPTTTMEKPTTPGTTLIFDKSVTCDFEEGPCGWMSTKCAEGQSPTSSVVIEDLKIYRWDIAHETPDRQSGSRFDHTYLGRSRENRGGFMFAASRDIQPDIPHMACLTHTGITLTSPANFSFWYYMNGQNSGTLSLSKVDRNGEVTELRNVTGSKGISWHQEKVMLDKDSNFSLQFKTTVKDRFAADVEIDDVVIETELPVTRNIPPSTSTTPKVTERSPFYVRTTASKTTTPTTATSTTTTTPATSTTTATTTTTTPATTPTTTTTTFPSTTTTTTTTTPTTTTPQITTLTTPTTTPLPSTVEIYTDAQTFDLTGEIFTFAETSVSSASTITPTQKPPSTTGMPIITEKTTTMTHSPASTKSTPTTTDIPKTTSPTSIFDKLTTCDFEDGPCGWKSGKCKGGQHSNSSLVKNLQVYHWDIGSKTPDRQSGSDYDHTYNGHGRIHGHFMYAAARDIQPDVPHIACLTHTGITLTSPANFSFWFYMNGVNSGALSLSKVYRNDSVVQLFSISGSQGRSWVKEEVTLEEDTNFSLQFKTTVKDRFAADVAIDDVVIKTELPATRNIPSSSPPTPKVTEKSPFYTRTTTLTTTISTTPTTPTTKVSTNSTPKSTTTEKTSTTESISTTVEETTTTTQTPTTTTKMIQTSTTAEQSSTTAEETPTTTQTSTTLTEASTTTEMPTTAEETFTTTQTSTALTEEPMISTRVSTITEESSTMSPISTASTVVISEPSTKETTINVTTPTAETTSSSISHTSESNTVTNQMSSSPETAVPKTVVTEPTITSKINPTELVYTPTQTLPTVKSTEKTAPSEANTGLSVGEKTAIIVVSCVAGVGLAGTVIIILIIKKRKTSHSVEYLTDDANIQGQFRKWVISSV